MRSISHGEKLNGQIQEIQLKPFCVRKISTHILLRRMNSVG